MPFKQNRKSCASVSNFWLLNSKGYLEVHLRLSTILETRNKMYEVMFFHMYESAPNALYIEIKQKS